MPGHPVQEIADFIFQGIRNLQYKMFFALFGRHSFRGIQEEYAGLRFFGRDAFIPQIHADFPLRRNRDYPANEQRRDKEVLFGYT